MALLHRRQIVNQDNLKDYLENIPEFRLGRIIRKGREVKNSIVYVEKSENGFLSDRVRLRNSTSSSSSSSSSSADQQQCSSSSPSPSTHGRRIWVAKEILMCSGHVNCQRDCGGMGSCLDDCSKKDEKRAKSGHRCSFRVNIRMYLHNIGNWEVDVMGRHVPPDHVWIPPKKDVIKKMKLNPSRLDTQTHLSMIVPKIETTDSHDDVTSHNVCTEQMPDSHHIASYCSNNYERQKTTMTLDSISYHHRNDLENEEALDLTQNQKSTTNLKDENESNGLLTNKVSDKPFNEPTQEWSRQNRTPQIPETFNNHADPRSQKFPKSLSLFKEAVRLSEDGIQVFVIVSADKNSSSFSYWGTKDLSDKFTSSQPLTTYNAFTCYNVFDNFTTNTQFNTTTTTNNNNNNTNNNNNNNNSINNSINNNSYCYNRTSLLPPSPPSIKGHLKIPSLYSLKKRSSLSFLGSSPNKKKKRQPDSSETNSLRENRVRKTKPKASKAAPPPQENNETPSAGFQKRDLMEAATTSQDITTNKKGKSKNELNVSKDAGSSSLLQRERSQALLRILMSRKRNLLKSETNEILDEQKMQSLNGSHRTNANRQSSGHKGSSSSSTSSTSSSSSSSSSSSTSSSSHAIGKDLLPAKQLSITRNSEEKDEERSSAETLLQLKNSGIHKRNVKNEKDLRKFDVSSVPEKKALKSEKRNKKSKKKNEFKN